MADATNTTNPSFEDRVARAIYDAFEADSTYVGAYQFFGGDTVLDGQFDLNAVARAAIKLCVEEAAKVIEAKHTNNVGMVHPMAASDAAAIRALMEADHG